MGIYHIHVVGPAMPRPAPRLGTQSFPAAVCGQHHSLGAPGSHGYGSHHFPWSIGYWPIPCHGQSACHMGAL